MKRFFAVLLSLALGLTLAAQPPAAKNYPATKAPAAKAGAKKEEPPKIEGMEIARGGERGYLGIQIVNATFKLSFYDAKRKPAAPDVARAVLRWDPKYKIGEERVVLNPTGDNLSLSSARNIRPPYQFKLFISLFKDAVKEGDSPVAESYVIDFRQ